MSTVRERLDQLWPEIVAIAPAMNRERVLYYVENLSRQSPAFQLSSPIKDAEQKKKVADLIRSLLGVIGELDFWVENQLRTEKLREVAIRVCERADQTYPDEEAEEEPVASGPREQERLMKDWVARIAFGLLKDAGVEPTTTRESGWEKFTVILFRIVTGRRPVEGVRVAMLAFKESMNESTQGGVSGSRI